MVCKQLFKVYVTIKHSFLGIYLMTKNLIVMIKKLFENRYIIFLHFTSKNK